MLPRQHLFESLKAHLKARNLTYQDIALALNVSEQTIKRVFIQQDCSLERLEKICELIQLDLRDLVQSSPRQRKNIQQLTYKQEAELAEDKKLLMVAVCTMTLWPHEDIQQHLQISPLECETLLQKLDRMGFLDLMPGNRIRLRVAREFSWIVDGPIMRMVKSMAGDYFDHLFEGDGEILKIINVRLSKSSAKKLRARLELIAEEYADQVAIDAHLPLMERPPLSICIAARRWVPAPLKALMGPRAPKSATG